jgi:hypothetical protein
MSIGTPSIDRYRATTAKLMPAGSTKRQTCVTCGRAQSIGQYGIGESVCKTCRPKPAGWRRGSL